MSNLAWYTLGLLTLPIATFLVFAVDWLALNWHRGIGLTPNWVQVLYVRRRLRRMTYAQFVKWRNTMQEIEPLLKRGLGSPAWSILLKEIEREELRRAALTAEGTT